MLFSFCIFALFIFFGRFKKIKYPAQWLGQDLVCVCVCVRACVRECVCVMYNSVGVSISMHLLSDCNYLFIYFIPGGEVCIFLEWVKYVFAVLQKADLCLNGFNLR